MNSKKAFLPVALLAACAMCSCYHELSKGGGGGGGGGGGSNSVSFTLVSDTLPANLGLISFRVLINTITLTSSTNVATTLNLNNGSGIAVDLVRAQSDSIFLGTVPGVPSGTNSSITVALTGAQVAFFNGTGASITNLNPVCPANAVCSVTLVGAGAPVITLSQAISGNTGFGIDVNLANAITLKNGAISLNFANTGTASTNVVSAFALPRSNSNLAAGQLDLIEDFTGVASLGSPGVTITSASVNPGRGSIAAATSSMTNYDPDPTGTVCPRPTAQLANCVSSNQPASMDAILNSNGSFTVQEIEPLSATLQDRVEGTVVSINPTNPAQFAIVATDILPAAKSVISGLSIGQFLTVNLSNVVAGGFLVDTKGLPVGGALGNFQGATTTSALHLGQSVAVHVNTFTVASGTNPASCTSDTVTLRFSRFIATVQSAATPLFNVTAIPGFFGFTSSSIFGVQTFAGSLGADGVTNLDGPAAGPSTANLVANSPVAVRALFIEDAGNTLNPAFFAAKVRQH